MAPARRGAQVGLGVGEQAVAHLAVGSQANPVAIPTERAADAGDDPDRGGAAVDEETLGGALPLPDRGVNENRSRRRASISSAVTIAPAATVPRVEGHLLDEAKFVAALQAPPQEVRHISVVDVAHRDSIDLDRREPGVGGGLQPRSTSASRSLEQRDEPRRSIVSRETLTRSRPAAASAGGQPVEADPVRRHGDRRARVQRRDRGDDSMRLRRSSGSPRSTGSGGRPGRRARRRRGRSSSSVNISGFGSHGSPPPVCNRCTGDCTDPSRRHEDPPDPPEPVDERPVRGRVNTGRSIPQ